MNTKPEGFVYPAGGSKLESALPHNPILSAILKHLPTPSLLALYYTSHTTHYYLHSQRRYFRNLALVGEGYPEKWTPKIGYDGVSRDIPDMLVRLLERKGGMWVGAIGEVECGSDYTNEGGVLMEFLSGMVEGLEIMDGVDFSVPRERVVANALPAKAQNEFYPRLMGRHLLMMLNNYPIGRRLTTLIIDGTGVETESLKIVLGKMECSLRGVSARRCPNIECFMWSEWIMEAMYEARPLALEWLRIYGSGNTPTSTFNWNQFPTQLTPLPDHPLDPQLPTIDLNNYVPPVKLFANVIPFSFHLNYTASLIPPLHLTPSKRAPFLNSIRVALSSQRRAYQRLRPRPEIWNPPGEFLLRDPHPLITLISLTKYRGIKLDITYCANLNNCYSYLYARPSFEPRVPPAPDTQPISLLLVNNVTGETTAVTTRFKTSTESTVLHTHCVAEIGRRRDEGGGKCSNCGMWEDMYSPESMRGPGVATDLGGVKTGEAIGKGRMSVGSLCADCVVNMTCESCNAFYCNSCFLLGAQPTQPNPMANQPTNTRFLKMPCSSNVHGPYCSSCIEENMVECVDCFQQTCRWCMNPEDKMIKTNLFGREINFGERYGVGQPLDSTRVGRAKGWDEYTDPDDGLDYSNYALSEGGESVSEDDDGSADRDDYDMEDQYGEETVSDTRSSQNPTETVSKASDSDSDSGSDSDSDSNPDDGNGSAPATSQVPNFSRDVVLAALRLAAPRNPPPILLVTRIFEHCTQCVTTVCSYCLNYDEPPKKHSEYQSCVGGCAKRLCSRCLVRDEINYRICETPGCKSLCCNECLKVYGNIYPWYSLCGREEQYVKDGRSRYAWWKCPTCCMKIPDIKIDDMWPAANTNSLPM